MYVSSFPPPQNSLNQYEEYRTHILRSVIVLILITIIPIILIGLLFWVLTDKPDQEDLISIACVMLIWLIPCMVVGIPNIMLQQSTLLVINKTERLITIQNGVFAKTVKTIPFSKLVSITAHYPIATKYCNLCITVASDCGCGNTTVEIQSVDPQACDTLRRVVSNSYHKL